MFTKTPIKFLAICLAGVIAASFATAGNYGYKSKKAKQDLVGVAASAENFTTLVAAVKAADLVDVLQGEGPYTVFAPTDEAFAALPEGTIESLLRPENKDKLVSILTYHVVPAKVLAKDVAAGKVATANGSKIEIAINDGTVMVQDANVVATDIMASNGVIHVIDKVIIPEA
ncbi:fasciclin domain-containing protein [Pelagicoccus mobilis]|uniref:Fasciclin domain-containing protein n=1 Tax=Pelagicoccus mobilis TaxID=415221 RepID=A0A934RUK4_9BACT|nr:fasciclin domain-containing protein [Pelagicoccus mobilis]MBK1876701.1 fasciclin domain-containing protein [Pelagicoccus mobilis]